MIPLLLVVGIFALFVTPYSFEMGSEGKLTPRFKNEVFAPMNGVISHLYLPEDPDEFVKKNTLLARLTNEELNAQIDSIEGSFKETKEQLSAITKSLRRDEDLKRSEEVRLVSEKETMELRLHNLLQQRNIKRKQLKNLDIYSPADGQVVTWQYKEKLMQRPVKVGDNIMTVINPDGPWELELEMPEKKMGHLLDAKEKVTDLQVTFVIASDPKTKYYGKVAKIGRKSEVRSDQGNTVLVRVEFEKSEVPKDFLLEGTRVTARVHCGTRSIGYVMFHEVIETFHKNVLFWL